MKKYCFGVDVGGTTVKVGLFTVEGQLLDKWEIITRTENNGENISGNSNGQKCKILFKDGKCES